MEICHVCRKPIHKHDLVWVEVQTCKQSFSSPAEYSDEPMHRQCRDYAEDDDGHDAAWARHLSANPDARDCS
jgi:hypothetical protein